MIKEEIDQMPAGKEMERLIAEKVMGWHGEQEETYWPNTEWVWRNETGLKMRGPVDFSMDDAAAIRVLSRFHQWEIRKTGQINKEYIVILEPYKHPDGRAAGVGEGNTLALAICRAALKTTLMEVKR